MYTQASNLASGVDRVFWLITGVSLFLLVGITFCMVYFAYRYQRARNPVPAQIEGHTGLEVFWTVTPTLLVLGMFWFGWNQYALMRNAPPDAMTVHVTGQMWQWTFQYENGVVATDALRVPFNKPVKLILKSNDVLHSFFVPAFRVKMDVLPNRETYLWFTATQRGTFDVQCAEYCGTRHSYMLSKVIVMPESEFDVWYRSAGESANAASSS